MKKLFITLSIVLVAGSLFAQGSMSDAKRMFIYHFTKYIEWPVNSGDFNIAVVDDKEMYATLKKAFHGLNRSGKTYSVTYYDGISELKGADYKILYLSGSESKKVNEAADLVQANKALLITDRNGLGKAGSGINFKLMGGTLKFEMNLDALEQSGLKVSGQLKQVAILL